jgi:hypothetical protein
MRVCCKHQSLLGVHIRIRIRIRRIRMLLAYGNCSGSFRHQAKIVMFCNFLSLKNDVNVPVFRIRILNRIWIRRIRIYFGSGSGSASVRSYPYQNVTDLQHWPQLLSTECVRGHCELSYFKEQAQTYKKPVPCGNTFSPFPLSPKKLGRFAKKLCKHWKSIYSPMKPC